VPATIVKGYNLRGCGYITKPLDAEKFREIVQRTGNFWFTMMVMPEERAAKVVNA
jgi:hypothetical protein